MYRIWYSSLFSAFLLVLILLAWIVLLPIQLGGVAAFVIVNGASMEPTYHKGDLVITRTEALYGVGDIVTYYNADIKRPVIHRIIAEDHGTFVLQGDNNPWVDDIRPTSQDIIGKAWLHLPRVGGWLATIQTPLGISLLAGGTIFLVLSMYALRDRRFRTRRKKMFSGRRLVNFSIQFEHGDATMKTVGRQLEVLLFIFVIIFVSSTILAIVSFTKERTLSTPVDTEYIHVGLFSYFASSQTGVYDTSGPETGDPIFLKTTCQVNVHFDYFLTADTLSDVKGTISLRAETRDVNGWTRTFPLVASTPFEGGSTAVQAMLNPCEILATLRSAEEKTQLHRDVYNLIIIPDVNIKATNGGQPMESTFTPRLVFYLDDYQMYVLTENPDFDPLAPFKTETAAVALNAPNQIQLPGFSITVGLAQAIAVIGLLTSLVLGGFVGWSVYTAAKQDPSITISLRYGTLLVNVNQVSFDVRSREIVINSIDDLAKLAERNATAIMHLEREGAHDFLVEGNNLVYRYRLPRRRL
jgi:signal peptidase I